VNPQRLPWNPADGDDVVIRESTRSRRLMLRVHETSQVEVVVPVGTPLRLVQQFVGSHLDWIATRVARARARARPAEVFPPPTIDLVALGEHWRLESLEGPGPATVREREGERLLLTGSADTEARRAALRRWVLRRAQAVLPDWLGEIAALHGFRHAAVSIRLQRSRWGSCSAKGDISLNAALLFQRPDVLRYLFVHELAHTKHLNHSRRFWSLVAACEPGFRELDAQLRQGWRNVPDWLRPQRKVNP
jgi:predicted metal-dependent hydrolase